EEHKLEVLESNDPPRSVLHEEWDADLDYVLVLSLQTDNHPPKATAADGFWATKESEVPAYVTVPHFAGDEVIVLPCEFCEELYPADDLILHQTGCNPASAFASFSKRSSSARPRERDDWRALGSKSTRSLSSSQPPAAQVEGKVMIPCELCGIQLEEEMLFPHQ
ncbi:TRAD1 protein, partial [Urocolius indicus]|nr:TRAD1 protein [Urocolius indicus]